VFQPPHEDIPAPDTSAKLPEPAPDRPGSTQADEQVPQPDTSTKAPELEPETPTTEPEPQPETSTTPPQPEMQPPPDSYGKTPVRKPGRAGFELPYEKKPAAQPPDTTGTPDADVVSPRLHHRKKPAVPETTPPEPKGPIGFRPPEKSPPVAPGGPETPAPAREGSPPAGDLAQVPPAPKEPIGFRPPEKTPSVAPTGQKTPVPAGEGSPPAGGISQMPPAREISGAGPGAGDTQASRPATTMSSTSGTPRPEAGVHGGPTATKGSVVSNVEPEGAGAAARQDVGPAQVDAELADELAVRAAVPA